MALLGEDFYLVYPFQCPPGTAWDQYEEASGGCDPISEISRCGVFLRIDEYNYKLLFIKLEIL